MLTLLDTANRLESLKHLEQHMHFQEWSLFRSDKFTLICLFALGSAQLKFDVGPRLQPRKLEKPDVTSRFDSATVLRHSQAGVPRVSLFVRMNQRRSRRFNY